MKNRRVWIGLSVLLLANYLTVFLQNVVANWQWRHQAPLSWFFPEGRYWLPALVVFLPLVPMVLLKFRVGKRTLAAILLVLAAIAVGYLVKPQIPGTRRQQCIAACDWAVERIRADYKGPKADAEPFFSWLEYHPRARPCVEAHETRVPYLLGGRGASLTGCGRVDIPDYIVDEPQKVTNLWWSVAGYEKLDERKFDGCGFLVDRLGWCQSVRREFGGREFVIYRRVR